MSTNTEEKRTEILRILSDLEFHSGEDIGEMLGVTRASVSKHVKALTALGLDIYSVTGKGYKLANKIELLDEMQINKNCEEPVQFELLNVIDSTNDYLRSKIDVLEKGHTCIAEAQTNGKGRRGNKWVSPFGSSLYLSQYWSFSGGYQSVTGLSLAVGVAVNRTLERIGIFESKLKWPNDVYLDHKKLAGVLIELEGQMDAECECVIGIGLNVNLPEHHESIGQPWIDLSTYLEQVPDRNILVATLASELYRVLIEFEQHGLKPFVDEWKNKDEFAGKPVHLISGNNKVQGINRGIDDKGALLLQTGNQTKTYYGGEISVRPA